MSKVKVVILLLLTIIGLISSLSLLSMTLKMEISAVEELADISKDVNCVRAVYDRWSSIFGMPQSILLSAIYTGMTIFFAVALFMNKEQTLPLLIIPFIASIFNIVYSLFVGVNRLILEGSPICIFTLSTYAVNIVILILLIVPYMKLLTDALKDLLKSIKLIIISVIIILFSVGAVLFFNYQLNQMKFNNISNLLNPSIKTIDTKDSPSRGTGELGIEIVVFEDFQCPACRRTAHELKKLMDHYDNKLKLVFKHYPLEPECFPVDIKALHEYACEASYASVAAMNQGKFWEYYDLLFSNSISNTEILTEYAEQIGLDMDKYNEDYNSDDTKAEVFTDAEEGQKELGITATPTLFFNGRQYTGSKSFNDLKMVVEYLLKEKDTNKDTTNSTTVENEGIEVTIEEFLEKEPVEINTESSPIRGENEYGIDIVIFEDFQCPSCRSTAKEIEEVMEHYDNKINLIFKHYPLEPECFPVKIQELHDLACEASYASIAAMNQDEFWNYYDLLYSEKFDSVEDLNKYAEEINLDMEKFKKDYEAEKTKDTVKADTEEGFNTLGIKSTPTIYINGYKYTGTKHSEYIIQAIEYIKNKSGE